MGLHETKKDFTLIDGSFSSSEAWEIIRNLYTSKIRFHEMKNFSLKERMGMEDPKTSDRIRDLKENMEAISKLLLNEDAGHHNYEIKSSVSITVSDDKNQNV